MSNSDVQLNLDLNVTSNYSKVTKDAINALSNLDKTIAGLGGSTQKLATNNSLLVQSMPSGSLLNNVVSGFANLGNNIKGLITNTNLFQKGLSILSSTTFSKFTGVLSASGGLIKSVGNLMGTAFVAPAGLIASKLVPSILSTNTVTSALSQSVSGVRSAFSNLGTAVTNALGSNTTTAINGVKSALSTTGNVLSATGNFAKNLGNLMGTAFITPAGILTSKLMPSLLSTSTVTGTFNTAVTGLKTSFGQLQGAMQTPLQSFGSLKTAVSGGLSTLTGFITSGLGNLKNGLAQSAPKLLGFAKNIGSGLASAAGTGLKALASIGVSIATNIISKIGEGIGVISSFSRTMEVETSLWNNALRGSGIATDDFMQSIIDIGRDTPYTIDEVSESFRRMHATGVELDVLPETFNMLGNVAAATGQPLNRLTKAFTDMQGAQRILAQDMNQLTNAGVPAWSLLADAINDGTLEMSAGMRAVAGDAEVTADAVREMSRQGLLGADAVEALYSAMDTKYAGAMNAYMETLNGQIDRFKELSLAAFLPIGDALNAGFLPALTSVNAMFKSMDDEQKAMFESLGVNVEEGVSFFDTFAGAVAGNIRSVTEPLGEIASQVLPKLLGVFTELFLKIGQGFEQAGPVITQIFEVLGDIGISVVESLIAVFDSLRPSIDIVINVIGKILPLLSRIAQTISNVLQVALEVLEPVFTTVFESAQLVIEMLIPIIDNLITIIGDTLIQVIDSVAPVVEVVFELFAEVVEALAPILGELIGTIVDILVPAIDTILDIARPVFTTVAQIIRAVMPHITNIINALSGPLSTVFGAVRTIGTSVFGAIRAYIAALSPAFNLVVGVINNVVLPIWQRIKNAAEPILQGVANIIGGIASAFGRVSDAVSSFIGWLGRIRFPSLPGWLSRILGGGSLPDASSAIESSVNNARPSSAVQPMGASLLPNQFNPMSTNVAPAMGNTMNVQAQYIDESYMNVLLRRVQRKGGI